MATGDADATADDAAAAYDGLRGPGVVVQRVQGLPDRAGGKVHLRGVPAEFVHRHVILKLQDNCVHAWLFDLSAALYVIFRGNYYCLMFDASFMSVHSTPLFMSIYFFFDCNHIISLIENQVTKSNIYGH
jgi:hypothetical protein